MKQSEFWQAPGNRRCFDTKLEDWMDKDMSRRSIGVLEYIDEHPLISKTDFKNNIGPYLQNKYSWENNKSTRGHFYRPIQFVEFIVNVNGKLSLSIDGKSFLKEVKNENYEKALDYYLAQLFRVSYPNEGAADCLLSLFPFRIMFKLFDEYEYINTRYFIKDINTITKYEDIFSVKNNLEDTDYLNELEGSTLEELKEKYQLSEGYFKWRAWIVSSLIELGIMEKEGKRAKELLFLSDSKKDYIHNIVSKMDYKDMFFDSEEDFDNVKNRTNCRKRDSKITNEVLKKSNFKCYFDENHKTFSTKTRPNYVEGHHIIHVSYQNNFSEDLDCEDNIIALCPTCHKAIHLAKEEEREPLFSYILENNEKLKKFDLTLAELMAISHNKSLPDKQRDTVES